MTRILASLAIAATAVLTSALGVHAAGGFNPPPPGAVIAGKSEFVANILLDPHNAQGDILGTVPADATTTAKQAQIQLRDPKKGTLLSEVSFRATPSQPFFLGCDLSVSDDRFLYTALNGALLRDWVPRAALLQLFGAAGVTVSPTNEPAIVEILTNHCEPDPRNLATADASAPGLLLMTVRIRFQVIP